MLTRKMNITEEVWGVCGTVSSILSGLETRSLGINTLGSSIQPRHSLSKSAVRQPLPGFN